MGIPKGTRTEVATDSFVSTIGGSGLAAPDSAVNLDAKLSAFGEHWSPKVVDRSMTSISK
jgi:hypothetical protein